MELIFVLLPFALLFAGAAVVLFVWAARSGQFDDLETPAVRILFDDDAPAAVPPAARPATKLPGTPAGTDDADAPDKEKP